MSCKMVHHLQTPVSTPTRTSQSRRALGGSKQQVCPLTGVTTREGLSKGKHEACFTLPALLGPSYSLPRLKVLSALPALEDKQL